MGHKTNSDIYSHYHSAVSTVNLQEMFRDIRAGNEVEMHGLSLNRIEQLPQTISEAGWLRMNQDPEIVEAGLELSRMKAELCASYGSTSAAIRACDPRVESLVTATARLKNRRIVLTRAIYNQEYRMSFTGQHPPQAPTIHYPGSGSVAVGSTLAADAHGWELEVARDEEAVQSLDEVDLTGAVDPPGQEAWEEACDEGSSLVENEVEGNGDPFTGLLPRRPLAEGSEAIRIHNINDGKSIPKNMSIARFREAVGSGGYTDKALSDLMVEIFSSLHRSGYFIPGEEPPLGTYTCRFSGVDLSSDWNAPETAHCAHTREVKKAADEAFEGHLLPVEMPCSFYAPGIARSPKLCGFSAYKTRGSQRLHVSYHTLLLHGERRATNNIPLGEWHCHHDGCAVLLNPATNDNRDRPKAILSTSSIFASERAFLRHVYCEHRLSPYAVQSVPWCGICERFLEWEQFGTGQDNHFAGHWEQVWDLVEKHGYDGQNDNGRRTIPSFCPFCLHNQSLTPTERISTMMSLDRKGQMHHVATHIDDPGLPASFICPCFPTTCKYQKGMDSQDLARHLKDIHGITLPTTSRTKARALAAKSVNVGSRKRAKKVKD